MAQPKQVTINQLYAACRAEIKKGNGDKYLVVSDDNEGNGYHGCFFAISPIPQDMKDYYANIIYDNNAPLDEIMILG